METVTKKELAYRIAARSKQRKVVVKRIIQQFISEIIAELAQGNRLEFREFGVFEIKKRAARKARNPRTGEQVDVPGKVVVHFKAGRMMKDLAQRSVGQDASADVPQGRRKVAATGGAPLAPSAAPVPGKKPLAKSADAAATGG